VGVRGESRLTGQPRSELPDDGVESSQHAVMQMHTGQLVCSKSIAFGASIGLYDSLSGGLQRQDSGE